MVQGALYLIAMQGLLREGLKNRTILLPPVYFCGQL
jgi:hypothetical protein